MELEKIPHVKGQWLSDALKAKDPNYTIIPNKVILNKLLPGLGATHMEITSKRHSIIIEPNVPVILGKVEKHPTVLAIWEKCTPTQIKNYLKNKSIQYKKLITTPEGYKKIREVIYDGFEYVFDEFFMLFDECEKIIQDYDYRPNISVPINDFFEKFKQKAFVSATPIIPTDPRFEEQGFRILQVEPQYTYKKDITLTVTNDVDSQIIRYIKTHHKSNCICVFLNKTNSINAIINTLGIESDSKVFCSDESAKKLRQTGFKSFPKVELPLAKYNFFTSRFYSAVDIKLSSSKKPDILIVSNKYEYTRVDPNTEVIQIYGRFRNGFNSLTHIAHYDKDIQVLEDNNIDKIISVRKEVYDLVINLMNENLYSFLDVTPYAVLRQDLQKLSYNEFLGEGQKLNYFALDNFRYTLKINSYYNSYEKLLQAYEDTNHFNVSSKKIIVTEPTSTLNIKNLPKRERREQIVNDLERAKEDVTNRRILQSEYDELEQLYTSIDDFIVEVYSLLGKAVIEKQNYSEAKLNRQLTKEKTDIYRKSQEVAQEVYNNFKARENKYIDKTIVQKELQDIYDNLDIQFTVKLGTIREYYDASTHNSITPPSFKLKTHKM